MAETIYLDVFETGFVGKVGIAVGPGGLLRVRMFVAGEEDFLALNQSYQEGQYLFNSPRTDPFRTQIREYFQRKRQAFSFPIDWSQYTSFQKAVLQETLTIPYGETRSYGAVAAAVGNPRASQAVGQAEKRNQTPLVVPCHRVIGSDGSLTGYGGPDNIDLKARLLAFEEGK